MKRRQLIQNLGLIMAATPFLSMKLIEEKEDRNWEGVFSIDKYNDEKFWKKFRKEFFKVSDEFINLENGYFGVLPNMVRKAYFENIKKVNEYSSRYMRTDYNKDYSNILDELAQFTQLDKDELLITRNATEALNIIIQGLDFKKGDEVILHKQDYYSMIETFQMLEKTKGIKIKYTKVPLLPENDEEIINCYRREVTNNTKCILVTHMIHLTGQIMPVKKIADTFRPKGIEIIVDAAHSFAQLDFKLSDLGADFVGVNLHKWFSNPLGAGLLYVKKNRINDLKPLFGDAVKNPDNIKKLGHFGTLATPIVMTIPTAKKYNDLVTIPLKEKRLRHLQNYWTKEAAGIQGVQVTTPLDRERSCSLASFKIESLPAKETVRRLNEEFNVFTVIRQLEDEQVIRVTPNLYNHPGELDQLLEGIKKLSRV